MYGKVTAFRLKFGRSVKLDGVNVTVSKVAGPSMSKTVWPIPVASTLLLHGDAAMYHIKSAGRYGYSFVEAWMNANAVEQLQLLYDLRMAETNGELRLHYQPKFEAPAEPVRGFEALLRWQHPQRGLLSPDVFLPMAEKTWLTSQWENGCSMRPASSSKSGTSRALVIGRWQSTFLRFSSTNPTWAAR